MKPHWTNAPAILAVAEHDPDHNLRVWEPADPETWINSNGTFVDWRNLRNVTPLYPITSDEQLLDNVKKLVHDHSESDAVAMVRGLMDRLAEAWEEGFEASETRWRHVYDGHPVPEGEMCHECSAKNPYRQGQDS